MSSICLSNFFSAPERYGSLALMLLLLFIYGMGE